MVQYTKIVPNISRMKKLKSLREKAIKYRKQGYSYGFISKKICISKSTLSNWLQRIAYTPNEKMIKKIGLVRTKLSAYQHNQMIKNVTEMKLIARKELGELNDRDLWLLGIGLYLGEGSKTYENVRIVSSDPKIVKLSILWFKRVCGLQIKNFSPAVHIYPDNDQAEALRYWSKITGIPVNQFQKTQVDRRVDKSIKKIHKLPYGTINLQIRSRGNKECGVTLHRRIMGWIEAATEQVTAGIV